MSNEHESDEPLVCRNQDGEVIRRSNLAAQAHVGASYLVPGEFVKTTNADEWKFEWKVQKVREDRFQILTIPRRDLLDIITGKTRITNIPDGAIIEAVNYDFVRDAICLRVSHPSFDAVLPGAECRRIMAEFEEAKR